MDYQLISTVTTAASSYALTDLATAKDELQIPTADTSKDAFLTRAIAQVSAAAANYCNRVFPVETVQDAFYPSREMYPYWNQGVGTPLQLSRWPVVSVTSVVLTDANGNTTTLTAGTDFLIDADRGWLTRLNSATKFPTPWDALQITAIYEGGYSTIPVDVVDAALRMITGRFQARGRDPYLKSQTQPGLGDRTFWVGNLPGVAGAMTQEVEDLLDNYRVPVTG